MLTRPLPQLTCMSGTSFRYRRVSPVKLPRPSAEYSNCFGYIARLSDTRGGGAGSCRSGAGADLVPALALPRCAPAPGPPAAAPAAATVAANAAAVVAATAPGCPGCSSAFIGLGPNQAACQSGECISARQLIKGAARLWGPRDRLVSRVAPSIMHRSWWLYLHKQPTYYVAHAHVAVICMSTLSQSGFAVWTIATLLVATIHCWQPHQDSPNINKAPL